MQHFGIPFAGGMFHVMESQNCARIRDFVKNAFTLLDAKISVVSHDAPAPAATRIIMGTVLDYTSRIVSNVKSRVSL